jgi:phosphoglycerate dehydrogenase-like enzyme
MRRSATARTTGTTPSEADETVPPGDLEYLLASSEYIVLAAPLTEETRDLIDARAFASMRPDAVLINIARGGLVEDAALIEALREGRIAGAALDVFREEPLPADSPLWDLDRVLLAPHVSGGADEFYERATEVFCENLRRYLDGQPLRNLVRPGA